MPASCGIIVGFSSSAQVTGGECERFARQAMFALSPRVRHETTKYCVSRGPFGVVMTFKTKTDLPESDLGMLAKLAHRRFKLFAGYRGVRYYRIGEEDFAAAMAAVAENVVHPLRKA